MQLREVIDSIFEGKALVRPLFYGYPGGLRFELSEGRGTIERFLSGLRTAQRICADIFGKGTPLVACVCTTAAALCQGRALVLVIDVAG